MIENVAKNIISAIMQGILSKKNKSVGITQLVTQVCIEEFDFRLIHLIVSLLKEFLF